VEPTKLTEQELDNIREWSAADTQFGIQELAEIHVAELLVHIDAINAEHAAAMTRAREDADRVGAARMEFEDGQQKRIEALETGLRNLIAAMETIVEDAHNDHHLATNWATDRIEKALKLEKEMVGKSGY
jgi:hypothetical protein